ncbi:MAG: lamin tail domain-containing protein, partial [Sphaerochaetaceae bacterium]|nr:lamin tail domain-containing protein [Sphaerochaetaceae bacterium]
MFSPFFISAECKKNDVTVVFINGIFGNKEFSEKDTKALAMQFSLNSGLKDVTFINGFNESHGDGTLDLSSSIIQAYTSGYVDYDLTNILRGLHNNLKTQKIVLVGHSQGAFYTNVAYDYLVNHGVDKSAISVYAIGTPADYVAGDGKYLTSDTDEVINRVVSWLAVASSAKRPLPANIHIEIPNEPGVDYAGGHSFSQVYLALAPDKIVSDLDSQINKLNAENNKEECFVQPKAGTLYNVSAFGYKVVDNFGELGQHPENLITGVPLKLQASINSLFSKSYEIGQQLFSNISELFNNNLFGASLVSLPLQGDNNQNDELVLDDEYTDDTSSDVDGENNEEDYNGIGGYDDENTQQNFQNLLDDIQEELDIISQQIQELVDQQNQNNQDDDNDINDDDQEDEENNEDENNNDNENDDMDNVGGGGSVSYPSILISEVQINPIGNRFVELYNPNEETVYLTGWYMQRKDNNDTSWGSFVSAPNFAGKSIMPHGYFLISRQLANSDILSNITISLDNSLAIKNPNGEISDKVGFGSALDPELIATENPSESRSIGRKVIEGGALEETNNNFNDFEANIPTPKAQNAKYIVSEPKDTMAPEVIFSLNEFQTELTFPINFAITDPLVDTTSPSGLKSYVLRWQVDGGDWQEDAPVIINDSPLSSDFSRSFVGEDRKVYSFQVRAIDVIGNESAWLPVTPETTEVKLVPKILINEIQIDSIEGEGG